MTKYSEMSEFTLALAAAYKGFMKENDVTGVALTEHLGRALGYVSERVNGLRALDTEDVDALAVLAGKGWTGQALMIELVRRATTAIDQETATPVNDPLPEEKDPLDISSYFGDEMSEEELDELEKSGLGLVADDRPGIEEEQEADPYA